MGFSFSSGLGQGQGFSKLRFLLGFIYEDVVLFWGPKKTLLYRTIPAAQNPSKILSPLDTR